MVQKKKRFYNIMNSSFLALKENKSPLTIERNESWPVRQGRAFKIDLGHNNGPFLPKDVMHSNQKSTYLLAAKNILETQQSMSNLMDILSKQQQHQSKMIKSSVNVQNWFNRCYFIEDEAKLFDGELKKISAQESKLRSQMKSSYIYFLSKHQELCQTFIPIFHNLLRTIREQNNEQQNIFQEKKRELENLKTFRNKYLDDLVNSQRKIIKIEEFTGANQTTFPSK